MIRVLIADDSPVVQRTLISLLKDEPGIRVVGVASDGAEAVRLCRELKPDLITMDVFMPEMDGLKATRTIMQENPTRIVIISSMVSAADLGTSFDAINAGAVDIIEKPYGVMQGDFREVKARLVSVMSRMMFARPERRMQERARLPAAALERGSRTATRAPEEEPDVGPAPAVPRLSTDFTPEIICLGGSTGATGVLVDILSPLPVDYPVPIVVVQHIASGFLEGMVRWLDTSLRLRVGIAEPGEQVEPGHVLFAPDDLHLALGPDGTVEIRPRAASDRHVPSVDVLFRSTAAVYGSRAVGIVLSGMGRDGCAGLLMMRQKGAVTVAQSEKSSIVFGMPMVALKENAARYELAPYEMAELLLRFRA